MKCVGCDREVPMRSASEETLLTLGWYFWPSRAPVRYHGLVLCPDCGRGPIAKLLVRCCDEDTR